MSEPEAAGIATEQSAPTLDDILAQTLDGDDAPPSTESEAPQESVAPEAGEAVEDAEPEPDADVPDGAEPIEDDGEPEPPAIAAPEHWSAEDQATFATIPQAGQEFMLRRYREMEGDYTKKSQEVAEVRKAIDPYRPMLQGMGTTDAAAIQQLFQVYHALSTQPQVAVERIAQAYMGADWLKRYAPSDDLDDLDDPQDPKVTDALARVQRLEQMLVSQQQSAQQQKSAAAREMIETFKAEAAEGGALKHPHFDAVETMMGQLIQSGAAANLEGAYDQAVWATPELRQQRLDATKAAVVEQRKSAAKTAKTKVLPKAKAAAGGEPAKRTDLDSIISDSLSGYSG